MFSSYFDFVSQINDPCIILPPVDLRGIGAQCGTFTWPRYVFANILSTSVYLCVSSLLTYLSPEWLSQHHLAPCCAGLFFLFCCHTTSLLLLCCFLFYPAVLFPSVSSLTHLFVAACHTVALRSPLFPNNPSDLSVNFYALGTSQQQQQQQQQQHPFVLEIRLSQLWMDMAANQGGQSQLVLDPIDVPVSFIKREVRYLSCLFVCLFVCLNLFGLLANTLLTLCSSFPLCRMLPPAWKFLLTRPTWHSDSHRNSTLSRSFFPLSFSLSFSLFPLFFQCPFRFNVTFFLSCPLHYKLQE